MTDIEKMGVVCVNPITFLYMPDIYQTLHIIVKYYASVYLNDVILWCVCRRILLYATVSCYKCNGFVCYFQISMFYFRNNEC
jgi:hypothetical protein